MGISDVGDRLPGLDQARSSGLIHGHEYEQIEVTEPGDAEPKYVKGEVLRYADKAMYEAAPMASLQPKVNLLWMTPDPLGAIAAMSMMYEGKPITSLLQVSNQERMHYWEEMTKTHLNAPLESVKLHFMIEGVDRAFTHQMVRQRTAVYAQESLRFAVKTNLAAETPKPPSFYDKRVADSPSRQNDLFDLWDDALAQIERSYKALIASGVPAEDARGLLPQATTTRLHYVTDLRNLLEHAGNRLCTQAQFHWRSVFLQIRECIRNYWRQLDDENNARAAQIFEGDFPEANDDPEHEQYIHDFYKGWQFGLIADTAFVPQCYLQGRCTFRADFDRGCTIRGRVDHFSRRGVPSSEWGSDHVDQISPELAPISPEEWLGDPQAGWVR